MFNTTNRAKAFLRVLLMGQNCEFCLKEGKPSLKITKTDINQVKPALITIPTDLKRAEDHYLLDIKSEGWGFTSFVVRKNNTQPPTEIPVHWLIGH
jgi:hypothetical protein